MGGKLVSIPPLSRSGTLGNQIFQKPKQNRFLKQVTGILYAKNQYPRRKTGAYVQMCHKQTHKESENLMRTFKFCSFLLATSGFAARHIGQTTDALAPSALNIKYTYT